MPVIPIAPPADDEYAPFHAGYVACAGEHPDVRALLAHQPQRLRAALDPADETRAGAGYGEGKWSVKEVIGHLVDAERIFGYRLLRIARGDATPLPGWDQDAYVAAAGFDRRPLALLLAELEASRAANLLLLDSLDGEALARRGVANGVPVSARALVHILAGHAEHHLAILRERYGLET